MIEPAHPFIRYPNGTTRSCIRCGRPETDECHTPSTEDYAAEHDVIAIAAAARPFSSVLFEDRVKGPPVHRPSTPPSN